MIGEKETVLRWLQEQPAGRYECNKAKRKRTLTQNSYYWALLSELAGALGLSNDELHFQLLKRYSTPEVVAVLESVDIRNYLRYAEEVNRDHKWHWRQDENGRREYYHVDTVYYRVYKPSSEMDTKEFKRLLDGLISECQEVGIETLSAEQYALLKEGKQ